MSATSQAAPPADPRPTNRRPPLQRPTPSRCIRLHLDTHKELTGLKRPDETYDALVRRLMGREMFGKKLLLTSEESP